MRRILQKNIILKSNPFVKRNIFYEANEFKRYQDVHQKKLAKSQQLNRDQKITIEEYTFKFNANPYPYLKLFANQNQNNNLNFKQNIQKIDLEHLNVNYMPDTQEFQIIPQLKHNLNQHLDGKLFIGNKGIQFQNRNVSHQFLQSLSSYVKPSQDQKLSQLCQQHKCKYFSSTSNISSALIHLYFLFSNFRKPYLRNIMEKFDQPRNHMISYRKPSTFILKKSKENLYSIDSQKDVIRPQHQILMKMGSFLQYLFTTDQQIVKKELQRGQASNPLKNYYRYALVNNKFCLRSQIDTQDINPVTKQSYVFQIKSRAFCPIRYDVNNYKDYLDYPIKSVRGRFFSFQREYYDLIRGGFIKYAFQLKTGNMNGAFVAYHNTQKIFGYQYVPAKQIAYRIFGNQYNLDISYMCSVQMLYKILEVIKKQFDIKQDGQDTEKIMDKLKIGLYANNIRRCLIVMVQKLIFDQQYQMLPQKYQNTVYAYFTEYKELRNPVYEYQFQFYVYKNDVLVNHSDTYFTPRDSVKIQWRWQKNGRVTKQCYIDFLTQAYKLEGDFGNFNYMGIWTKIENQK